MKIETKFDIGDRVFFGNENGYEQGKVVDIVGYFFLKSPYIKYKIKPFGSSEEQEIEESNLYNSPTHLLLMQIQRYERQVVTLNNKIEELRARIEEEK